MKEKQTFTNKAETVVLEVQKDGFSAYLTIKETAEFINEKDILTLINLAGIKCGIERAQEVRSEQNIGKQVGKPFLVAYAENPLPAVEIHWLNTDKEGIFDEQLLQHHLDAGWYVLRNAVIAEIEVGALNSGMVNIFGEEIDEALIIRQFLQSVKGRNIKFDPETKTLIATTSGYVIRDANGCMHITDRLVVTSDVPEGRIYCKTDMVVQGNLENCAVRVAGSLKVEGSVHFCDTPGIFASGNIYCDSAEGSILCCGGSIHFVHQLRDCKLITDGGVVGADTGQMIGGYCSSGGSVQIGILGDERGCLPDVEIAVAPFTKELCKTEDEIERRAFLSRFQKALNTVLREDMTEPEVVVSSRIYGVARMRKYGRLITMNQEEVQVSV